MVTHTYQSGTTVSSMKNYEDDKNAVSTATGGMTGVSAKNSTAYLRTNSSSTAFLSTSSGAQQKTTTFGTAFTAPSANTSYTASLKILKTETGLDFSVGFNGETAQTVSFETDISVFDVIGIRSPVKASSDGITLSNFSITTTGTIIPEPAAFALWVGLGALAVAGTRRRRKK